MHTISNFTYSSTGTDTIELFKWVSGENAEIKNLGLINPNVNAQGNFVFEVNEIGKKRYDFVVGNIFDLDFKKYGTFDIVFF